MAEIRKGDGADCFCWHTQGSGKTALAFSNVHYLRDYFQSNGKIAKFYFIVDRIDLATQAKNEFEARGLRGVMVDSKESFKSNIASVGEDDKSGKTTITVVNIQKFSSESITQKSDYNVNVQRVYFMDEAHRSYNPKGSFLANLMASDREAVMIALTGTPLIGDGYNTKDIFGDMQGKMMEHYSIPAYDENVYPAFEAGESIESVVVKLFCNICG